MRGVDGGIGRVVLGGVMEKEGYSVIMLEKGRVCCCALWISRKSISTY